MAETTDRPRETSDAPAGAAAPAGGTELNAMPPPASEPYRPLSLQALAGFGIAVAYALIVVFGAAVALVNHIPWLLPTWTFLIPTLAALLCWIARTRIRNSERTLSGLPFTTWGLRLSVIVGLTYSAYYVSTYFAVRQQAIECADEFFNRLKQGRPDQAFLLTLGPASQRMSDEELRNMIEAAHNNPGGGTTVRPGPFTMFCEQEYVRMLEMGGSDARLTPIGMLGWDYEKGGYVAVLKYQAVTPYSEFPIVIALVCPDTKPGERGGPQWRVLMQRDETRMDSAAMTVTPQGVELFQQISVAHGFAASWLAKVNQMQWDEAYLETLPPERREAVRKGEQVALLLPAASVAGLAPLGLCDDVCRDYLAGRRKFFDGELIQIDEKKFWTTSQQRADILKRVRNTFHPSPGGLQPFYLQLQPGRVPRMRTSDGERIFEFGAALVYPDEAAGMPKYVVAGYLSVAVDERELNRLSPSGSTLRVKAIEFTDFSNGRTAPMRRPPQPGGQGQPGM
jgi:hypothetical protein